MLDTFIGSNDGVPFLIPVAGSSQQLCDTKRIFDTLDSVPDYIRHWNTTTSNILALSPACN